MPKTWMSWLEPAHTIGRFSLLVACMLAIAPSAPAHAATTRVSGRVIDSDSHEPIAGAEIELANTNGGQGFHRARTSKKGEFAIEGISSDRYYTLTVGAAGYADFVIGGWQIPAAQRAAELVVPLDRAGVLVVRALRSDGKTPVLNARVQLQTERGNTWWEGFQPPPAPRYTDAGGFARFEGLTAGYWTATVDGEGLRTAEARRIAVRRGETTAAPVKLGRPASISGVVRTADGTGIPGITITARGPAEQVATSGTEGAYTLGELAAGKYRLEASQEGFETATMRDPVIVREGEAREIAAITLTPKPPEFSFVLEREAFLPNVAPKLGLRSFRVGTIDLALYVIPAAEILNPTGDFRRYAYSGDTTGLVLPERWQHVPAAGPEWSWREEELTLPHALPPGAYLLRGRAGALERRTLFFVTDLGLLVKRSPSQVWVSAASLAGGAPAAGVSVYVIPQPVPPAGEGQGWSTAVSEPRRGTAKTDADGIAIIANTGMGSRLRIVAVSEMRGLAVVDAPIAPAAERGGDQAYLYTDRPIYRPGHTVNWKLFARKATPSGGWAMPDATTANITLIGPDGTTLPADPARVSARGSANGSIELPKDVALGDWTLRASAGNTVATATVAVQEYRKPEFKVEVTPDREVYVNGDEVRFRIAASYFFGAPVFGATVRYNLFEARHADDERADGDEFSEANEGDGGGAGYGRVLKTGETRTDLDGRAEMSLVPERVPYDRTLTLEVEVVDPSNRVVNGRGEAVMGRGLFTLSVRPGVYVIPAGRPVPIDVTARDHADHPVIAAVTVELDQEAWNPLQRRYTHSSRPLASQVVTTDSLGRGHVSLTAVPARTGRLIVRARADDSKGNRITAESSAWAFDDKMWSFPYRYPALEAFADRARYHPGDTARVLVNTDVKNAVVLVTVEGRDLLDHRVVKLAGNSGLVTVPIAAAWAPNVFVSVHVRKGMEVHSRVIELAIDAARHDLQITLTPDRDRARPGDTTTVRVRTLDGAGKPVQAEVSLGVVDEALYSIRADLTPDPHSVFYGRRPNWVTTVVSFPVLYYGGASKGQLDQVRKNFRDVAHWEPSVLTDASGNASVGFRYPDNLTTWRMTSRGMTADTRVGKTVAKTLVTKDVVARLAGPRFFLAGDQARLVSVVTNLSGVPLTSVDESIEAAGAAIEGPASAKTQIATRGESRGEWQVKIPEPARDAAAAEAVFTFRARSKADSDALEVRVPLYPRAVPLALGGAGVAQGPATLTVTLPPDLVRSGSWVTLDIASSPAVAARTAVQELLDYPYGCTEQTSNAILPATAFAVALKKAGVAAAGWEDPAKKLAPYLQRLGTLQKSEGGWGWWPEGEMDPYLTALAIDAVACAQLAGVAEVSNGMLESATSVLPRLFSEARSADAEAYLIAHLAPMTQLENAKDRFAGVRERLDEIALTLRSSPDALSNAGLALAARAHAELGMKTEASALVEALMRRAVKDAGGLHWEADPASEAEWWGEDISNTGYALAALVAANPGDPRAADVVQWLMRHRTGPWWRSTRVSAPVAQALAEYLAAHAAELKAQGTLRVDWNGGRVAESTIDPAVAIGAPLHVMLDGAKLKAGDNRIAIAAGAGMTSYWAWSARAMVPSPGPAQKPGTISVTREYLRAERTTDRRGRPRWLTTALAPAEAVRIGETVLVRLTLTATKDLRYVMLEDPRLAGFEIEDLLPDGAEWPYGTHAEERDDRAVFFVEHLDQGETTIEYLIRPEIDGRFTALPATASGMYDPNLVARSAEAKLAVEAKK